MTRPKRHAAANVKGNNHSDRREIAGGLDKLLCVEPSQPPRQQSGDLAGVPAVVGGQALVAERQRTGSNGSSLPARASEGALSGLSNDSHTSNPLEEGEAASAIAPSAEVFCSLRFQTITHKMLAVLICPDVCYILVTIGFPLRRSTTT